MSGRAFGFGTDPSEPHPPAQPGNAADMQVFFLNLCQVTVSLKWVDPRREEEGGVGPEGLQIADVEPNTEHELGILDRSRVVVKLCNAPTYM